MESKILISFDYEQKVPFIKIQYKYSDDERDKMVRAFLDLIGGDVCFTKFQYEHSFDTAVTVAGIRPIPFVNLKEEIKTMQGWIDHIETSILPEPQYNLVHNNSLAFIDFLKQEGLTI